MTSTFELPRVARYQRDAIFCSERNAIIEATTKAGKTFGCLLWLMEGAFAEGAPGRNFWWVAPIYIQAEMAFDRMCKMLREADPSLESWSANKSDLAIILDNGSTMRFKSAEKPDGLYGEDVYRAVMDEASRCREEAYHAIRTTLTAVKGKLRIIGNVKGRRNWAFNLARRVEAGGLAGWRYAKITAADAVAEKIISAAEVAAAKRELPEAVFRELYEAEPSEDGANPFGMVHIAACIGPMSDKPAAVFGVDLAKSVDWTVVIGLDSQCRVCVFERWQHEPWDRTESRIAEIVGDTPTLVDSTGVGDPIVEGMAKNAPSIQGFKFSSGSKQQIMEGLAVAIQKRGLAFPDGIIRQELESFEYEATRTGVKYTAPEGLHDDCVCALALAVEKARGHVAVTGGMIQHGAKPPPTVAPNMDARSWFEAKRADPNWGFGR